MNNQETLQRLRFLQSLSDEDIEGIKSNISAVEMLNTIDTGNRNRTHMYEHEEMREYYINEIYVYTHWMDSIEIDSLAYQLIDQMPLITLLFGTNSFIGDEQMTRYCAPLLNSRQKKIYLTVVYLMRDFHLMLENEYQLMLEILGGKDELHDVD